MKRNYLKPDAEWIKYEAEERIMDNLIIPSWDITDSDEEGRE